MPVFTLESSFIWGGSSVQLVESLFLSGWRGHYTDVRDVLGEGHQGPSPGRMDVVATSPWGVRKAPCAVGDGGPGLWVSHQHDTRR